MANIEKFAAEKAALELACKMAGETQIVANASSFFAAANIVNSIRTALTDEVIREVAMPLMNHRCGFLTDRTGKATKAGQTPAPLYSEDVVRDCITDAIAIGLLPVGNQFNIIGGRMYPTKEGYTALLSKLNIKYVPFIGAPNQKEQDYIKYPCKMTYYKEGEKSVSNYSAEVIVPVHSYDNLDQLRGKAERRLKKMFFEFITGLDFGDADENSGSAPYVAEPTAVQPTAVQPTADNKKQADSVFKQAQAQPDQVSDAQVVEPQQELTDEQKKAAYQETLARAKANLWAGQK